MIVSENNQLIRCVFVGISEQNGGVNAMAGTEIYVG